MTALNKGISDNSKKISVKIDAELADLIPGFLKNRETDIQAMQESLKQGDYVLVERIGHGMKGAGAGYGFDAITEIGAQIEKAAQDKDPEEVQKAICQLVDYVKRLEVRYE